MQIKGIRIYIVLVVVMLMLGLLIGAQYFYQRYSVEQPLFKLYSETKLVDNIKKIKLEKQGDTVSVTLALNRTDNLRQAYQDLYRSTGQVLGSDRFRMQLKDTRNRELENVYYQSQFVIYEALVKGSFPQMAATIEKNARSAGAEARVFIDEKNIYVALYKGENYLYEVVPRKNVPADNRDVVQMGSEQR
ncbi:MAG: hypothetical protein ACOY4Q_06130 [Bacillota bacterium]